MNFIKKHLEDLRNSRTLREVVIYWQLGWLLVDSAYAEFDLVRQVLPENWSHYLLVAYSVRAVALRAKTTKPLPSRAASAPEDSAK